MTRPRHCSFALDARRYKPHWWLEDHAKSCKDCKAVNAAAGLAEAHEVYAILHRYRNENRAMKAARKAQKQARKANRSRK